MKSIENNGANSVTISAKSVTAAAALWRWRESGKTREKAAKARRQ
jgi:hypothetical protein